METGELSNCQHEMDDSEDFSDEDVEDDPGVPRCGVSLAELKTRIKEEIVESGEDLGSISSTTNDKECIEFEENVVTKIEVPYKKDCANIDDEEEKQREIIQEELEFDVAHFLAETSISRRQSKKSKKDSIKSACKFKCNQCSALFRYKSTLTYHMKSECGTGVITASSKVVRNSPALCNICNKQLSSRTSLMVHLRIHTGERPFCCQECGQSFSQNAHLKDHIARLHSQEPDQLFLCRVCNTTFSDRSTLRNHMEDHAGQQRPFQCQICRKRYQTKERLSSHVCKIISEGHSSEDGIDGGEIAENAGGNLSKRGLHCTVCNFVATNRSDLREHVAHHPLPVVCPDCSERFDSLVAWRKHNRRYHKSRLSKCSFCGRAFPSEYDVRVHERSHTGERPYRCTFCGRGFARKSILDVHTTLHTGRRDYVCAECGSAFNRKSKLDVHRAEHTDSHVQCQICQKTFKCKAYLTSHLKTHEREAANFTCAICHRSFTTSRGLRSHLSKGVCPSSSVSTRQFQIHHPPTVTDQSPCNTPVLTSAPRVNLNRNSSPSSLSSFLPPPPPLLPLVLSPRYSSKFIPSQHFRQSKQIT